MMVGRLYLEHLTDGDLALLAEVAGENVRADPDGLHRLLNSPAAFRAVFGQPAHEPLLKASPFLLFALLLHRAARDLEQASFVEEWVAPRRRVPVFDVSGLREFAGDPMRRFFLVQLLASYTHVASGSVLVQTNRGWRRRRFSELDPLRLIELAELLPEPERPAVYRRLGDLSLFLTGIFPDYASERFIDERDRRRLQRVVEQQPPPRPSPQGGGSVPRPSSHPEESGGAVALLETIGARAYRIAQRSAERGGAMADVLASVSDNFASARRTLNFLTDRYLFPLRQRWFGVG
jgi:hypothetical protein